ncbi:hypothetical protein GN244_ATG06297 [Phytophthora infestans]|uniref:Uncharacterized protein n=1 Tax=Phytophthora infestans TaxID=4787 RepID=A0A833S650_PHYIN|nr:hypothetical protein GN244_ATG06297 [Phytophthora infestans]KAF4138200.1 hypothetical protein GN958_ATG12625 [Phytophthora infestans]
MERYSEWSFTETLSLDEVEIRERQKVDMDGEVCIVPYAHAIQGRETTKITYKTIRKVCTYLGVRYYKNQPKNVMLEIIAQKKLKGQVPESYRKKRKVIERARPVYQDENRNENRNPTAETHALTINVKRQRVETDGSIAPGNISSSTNNTGFHLVGHRNENVDRESAEETTEEAPPHSIDANERMDTDESSTTIPVITTSSNATNTFLQPLILAEADRRELSADNGSGIPTTPVGPEPPRIYVEMSLTDRVDTFNLLRHIRQQIQHVEDEIASASNATQISTIKTQRLTEDLHFYLAERRSLIQQLENSRYM